MNRGVSRTEQYDCRVAYSGRTFILSVIEILWSAVSKGRGIGDISYMPDPIVVEKGSEIYFCIKLRTAG